MRTTFSRWIVLGQVLLGLACGCNGDEPQPGKTARPALTGRVLDGSTRAPVPGAAVRAGALEALTDTTGRFALAGVPAGRRIVTVRAAGLQTLVTTVTVTGGARPALELRMQPEPQGGRTLFVAPNGDDGGAGTRQSPWRTLRHGTAALRPGDTLYLRAGVYHEHLRLAVRGSAERWTKLAAFPGERAVVDGQGVTQSGNGLVVTASYLRLEGLEVRNCAENAIWVEQSAHFELTDCTVHHATYGLGIADGSHHFRLTQVAAHDFDLYGFDVSPGGGGACHHGDFVACTARNGRDRDQNVDGFALGHGAQHDFRFERCVTESVYDGFDVSARDTTLVACLARGCWNSGFKLWQDAIRLENCVALGSSSANVELDWDEAPGTVTLQNCTLVGAQSYSVWVENSADRLRMFNCLLVGGANIGLAFEQRSAGRYEGDHNLFHNADAERAVVLGYEDEFGLEALASGAWARFSKQDLHSIAVTSAEGLFRDRAAGDFRLAPGSPAKDRGRAEGAPPVDFADRPRPAGKACDIGAFED